METNEKTPKTYLLNVLGKEPYVRELELEFVTYEDHPELQLDQLCKLIDCRMVEFRVIRDLEGEVLCELWMDEEGKLNGATFNPGATWVLNHPISMQDVVMGPVVMVVPAHRDAREYVSRIDVEAHRIASIVVGEALREKLEQQEGR